MANLQKLTLENVSFSLPALQPVASRLHDLNLSGSNLQGSADGFLTRGWTALTSLCLNSISIETASSTAALNLPALENVSICWCDWGRGEELQLDQLIGSCPHVSRLEFQQTLAQASKASRQSCKLLNLNRLADLHVMQWPLQAEMDLDLPPSLTHLRIDGYSKDGGNHNCDFFGALREAAKCARQGTQLRKLTCNCAAACLQPAQWGASLDEQYRRMGGQLSSLQELEVSGVQEQLLTAVGAAVSAAPSLVRLVIAITDPLPRIEVSPICSASLESVGVTCSLGNPMLPPPQVLLTFLPGCTRLQRVAVFFMGKPVDGAAVKIRCHCCSRGCIMPVNAYAGLYITVPKEVYAGVNSAVVNFLQMPPSGHGAHGAQQSTVLYACHAAGPKQVPMWGHAVMPGIL